MKKYLYGLCVVIIIVIGAVYFFSDKETNDDRRVPPTEPTPTATVTTSLTSPLDLSYDIDGDVVTFKNGKAEESAAPGSATTISSTVYGTPAYGSLGKSPDDAALMVIQEGGGTGVFLFVVAAYKDGGVYKGSKAFFVGDRVSPLSISISNNTVEVHYLDRKTGQAFSEEPTVPMTKYLVLKNGELVEK
jgi:hypothetical protein